MKDSIKKPLNIVAVLIGTVLALAVASAAYYYVYYILPPEQVNISVSYSPDVTCRADTPVYLVIKNDSLRDIINTSFMLSVKKESSGDNFIQLLEKKYSTDSLIKAGETYGGCWAYPKLITNHYVPEELIYEIKHKQIVFRD